MAACPDTHQVEAKLDKSLAVYAGCNSKAFIYQLSKYSDGIDDGAFGRLLLAWNGASLG
jgi:hypothetical protein